ncbi:MAG TPA: BON domain-containing protein [Verrucomicrobiae bacterium]|nr:BON domain-containing protein [Verrucomicrobiae bacterium]
MKTSHNLPKILTLALCVAALPVITFTTGCAGDRYHQSTGEAIDDHAISMRVKSALGNDNEYKYEGVSVTTFKGTVQLSGFVDTHAQKSKAATIAKGVEGVRDVENNITVKD